MLEAAACHLDYDDSPVILVSEFQSKQRLGILKPSTPIPLWLPQSVLFWKRDFPLFGNGAKNQIWFQFRDDAAAPERFIMTGLVLVFAPLLFHILLFSCLPGKNNNNNNNNKTKEPQ